MTLQAIFASWRQGIAGTLALVLAIPATAAEGDGQKWATSGRWNIFYYANGSAVASLCIAVQSGAIPTKSGNADFSIGLAQGVFTGKTSLSFVLDPPMALFGAQLLIYSGETQKLKKQALTDPKQTIASFPMTGDELGIVGQSDGLVITDGFGSQLAGLRYVDGDRGVQMLARCAREHANIDKGSGKPAVTKPALRSTELIGPDDYPAAALREGAAGRTSVVLTVSAKGLVSDCRVEASSGNALLDEQTCTLLSRRARFVPAVDVSGNLTESQYRQSITWTVPRD